MTDKLGLAEGVEIRATEVGWKARLRKEMEGKGVRLERKVGKV